MKKLLVSFALLSVLIFSKPIYAESPKEARIETKQEVQNFAEEQAFPDTCKIPVSLYLAIFAMSVGVVIYVK